MSPAVIRPFLVHPHLRGLKRCDPVARYHEFHRLWEAQRPPGEKTRNRLRWHIRVRRVEWWFHLYYYDVHICFLRSNCCIKMYLIMRFVVLSTVLVYIYSVCVCPCSPQGEPLKCLSWWSPLARSDPHCNGRLDSILTAIILS